MTKKLFATLAVALNIMVAAGRPVEAAPTVDELIDQGLDLRRQGKYEQALDLLQRAHAQSASPRTLAQIGLAEADLARWTDSEDHLAAALASDTFPWIVQHRGLLEKTLNDVRRHIGQLVIRGTPVGANVYVNGQPRGTLPLPLPIRVPEGEANVQVTAPGHQPFIKTVPVLGHGSAVLETQLERVAVAPGERGRGVTAVSEEATEHQRPTAAPGGRGLAIGLLVGGAVALGSGIFLLSLDQTETCDPKPGTRCPDVYSTKLPGWALVGVGTGAALGGGLLLYRSSQAQVAIAITRGPFLLAKGRF